MAHGKGWGEKNGLAWGVRFEKFERRAVPVSQQGGYDHPGECIGARAQESVMGGEGCAAKGVERRSEGRRHKSEGISSGIKDGGVLGDDGRSSEADGGLNFIIGNEKLTSMMEKTLSAVEAVKSQVLRQDQIILAVGNRVTQRESFVIPRLGEIGGALSQLREDLVAQRDYCASVLRELRAVSMQQVMARNASPDVLVKEKAIQSAETSASTEAVESLTRQVQGMEVCNHTNMIKFDRRLQELEAVHSAKEGCDSNSDRAGTVTSLYSDLQNSVQQLRDQV